MIILQEVEFRQKEKLFVVRRCANSLLSSETAGGADATLGQSQQADPLLCDAPRLGGHSRYHRSVHRY